MNPPINQQEALIALAVMSGVLRRCAKHGMYYRGEVMPMQAMPIYDRHIGEVRKFFPSPVAFYTALNYTRSIHSEPFCKMCTNSVGFN